ncbi:MAG: hypothetical protein AAGF19_06865 [Pseudomonadota bacterium]
MMLGRMRKMLVREARAKAAKRVSKDTVFERALAERAERRAAETRDAIDREAADWDSREPELAPDAAEPREPVGGMGEEKEFLTEPDQRTIDEILGGGRPGAADEAVHDPDDLPRITPKAPASVLPSMIPTVGPAETEAPMVVDQPLDPAIGTLLGEAERLAERGFLSPGNTRPPFIIDDGGRAQFRTNDGGPTLTDPLAPYADLVRSRYQMVGQDDLGYSTLQHVAFGGSHRAVVTLIQSTALVDEETIRIVDYRDDPWNALLMQFAYFIEDGRNRLGEIEALNEQFEVIQFISTTSSASDIYLHGLGLMHPEATAQDYAGLLDVFERDFDKASGILAEKLGSNFDPYFGRPQG